MASLIIYMSAEGRIPLSGGMLTQGRDTKVLRESMDYRPTSTVDIGERLMCSEVVSETRRRLLPTPWVVTRVVTYQGSSEEEFSAVKIAWCEKKELSLEEFTALIEEQDLSPNLPSSSDESEPELESNFPS